MTLTFNIIYTPGTVHFLSPFVDSLLRHSDCMFRLVSNGCLLPEQKILQHVCQADSRLEYFRYPSTTMVDHGRVLNHLHSMTTDPFFCFMDSDILATDQFPGSFQREIDKGRSVFSAPPIWMTPAQGILSDTFQTISGVHHSMQSGVCLGSSYFAIYHNDSLKKCIQESGVGFQTYTDSEIPVAVKKTLKSHGWLKSGGYDTAKVLNLLLTANGHDLHYAENDSMLHIGGFSFLSGSSDAELNSAQAFSQPLGRVLAFARNVNRRRAALRELGCLSRREKRAIVKRRLEQRDPVRRYFRSLLISLACGKSLPSLPHIGVKEIDAKLRTATELITKTTTDSEKVRAAG